MNAEELFLQKYGNKITASESWVIRFAEEYAKLKTDAVLPQADVRRSVTITIPLDVAETLLARIDSSVGTSDNDEFNKQMDVVLKKLERAISKHYA